MFTKILPAGDVIGYIKGPKNSHGEEREQPPELLRGNDQLLTNLLVAQGPFGVRPPKYRRAAKQARRPGTEWVRHCRAQLVHIISCFHETEDVLTAAFLKKIACATEDLILAGMPRDALHFTWYRHGMKKGSHAHAAMSRFLLRGGKRYELQLHRELRLRFDRLVSRRFGLADPVDPAGFRVVFGGRGSWKPENREVIRAVCQEATRRWRNGTLNEPGQLARLLPDFGLSVIYAPDRAGRPVLQAGVAGRGAPSYPHTVVARRTDTEGIIVFAGPACRGDFAPQKWRRRLKRQQQEVNDLQLFPAKVFAQFKNWFELRRAVQHRTFAGLPDDQCIGIGDFDWLDPESPKWEEPNAISCLTDTDVFGPEMDWGDRLYPFISDIDPDVSDIADYSQNPLRDWLEDDDAVMAAEGEKWNEEDAGEMPSGPIREDNEISGARPVAPAPVPETIIPYPMTVLECDDDDPFSRLLDALKPVKPPLPYYRPENFPARQELQVQISLSIGHAYEHTLLVNRKKPKAGDRAQEERERRAPNAHQQEDPPSDWPAAGGIS